jgi:tRNA G10  N-methylase Trm11
MTRALLLLLCSPAFSLHPYRVVFRDVHAAFRSEDVHSAAHDLGSVEHVSATSARLHLPDDAAAATLAERSVLVRYVLEEWGAGATLREAASRACVPPNSPLANGASWRIRVQSPGRRTGLVNAHDPTVFEALGGLLDALPGPVRLKDAEEDVAVLMRGEEVVIGRVVARGCAADLLSQYRVADRCYRGSTTMDATLAFVTASFARVRPGDLVLDPFCGTGGNLLAACHMSRRAGIGADADARTLLRGTARCDGGSLKLDARLRKAQNMANVGGRREKKRGEPSLPSDASIRRNFLDRGLDPPRLVVSDVAALDGRLDDEEYYFDGGGPADAVVADAIVCDPPYGVRERIDVGVEGAAPWRPALFELAATRLRAGRRLAFWVPSSQAAAPGLASEIGRELPPSLSVVAAATQALGGTRARTLLAVEKS